MSPSITRRSFVAALVLGTLSACGAKTKTKGADKSPGTSSDAPTGSDQAATTSTSSSTNQQGDTTMINVTANGTTWQATLANNSSAQAFADLLKDGPLTLHLHDYGSFEKVGSIGTSLPTNDSRITTKPGDFVLYQGSELSLFYSSNTWSYSQLGHINDVTADDLRTTLGTGDVDVTFSLSK